AIDGDPRNDRRVTGRWRERPTSRPEDRLVGVMYVADPVDGDIVVDAAAHWAFAGTGVRKGDHLVGLLGYEVDALSADPPAGIQRLAHSPYTVPGTSRTKYSDATIYTAPSGALVFATGSMQWSWGLDGYNAPVWHPDRTSTVAQQVTRNVLSKMLASRGVPQPSPPRGPSPIVIAASAIALVYVARAWIRSRNPVR
ncbi:MAG TPA: N,N-dimethylformamidase beta subunit family domain-containing protein, partial [Vicinamibacterales bacterium]|nr:N,N-dimethylformamidase beta subunit family domain-containing protein [Vicinamibacterales bacterium]